RVQFFWESRPDPITGYIYGGLVNETQRLNRIETQYNDPAAGGWRLGRKYRLSYNTSRNTNRRRLNSGQECDRDGYCLSPTNIGWQSGTSGWVSTDTASNSDPSALMKYSEAIDIDGDGRTDLVYPQSVSGTIKWFYMKANATGNFDGPVN